MRQLIMIILCILLLSPALSDAAEQAALPIKQQPELQSVKPKKPVRIKLRRTEKGDYVWELTGDNVDDIIRADKRLRKSLNME